MRVVLLSTYELGHQPFGLASPAAWLRRAGADVVVQDLSRQRLDPDAVRAADVIAFSLPMHTATRLALPVVDRVRGLNPTARLCAFGLYAPPNAELLRSHGVVATFGAEFEADLVAYASGHATAGVPHPVPRLDFLVPDRTGLPGPARYASLVGHGSRRIAGYTESSRGCTSLCRHCPVVPIYQGRFRAVPTDIVLADVRNQVGAGVSHITFGDPDFFNGPTHARRTVAALHDAFPDLTYDVTIKIEHLLRHESLLGLLRDTGCLFVTTAVESVDDTVLAALNKGHTAADFERAASICRQHGLVLAPTFVPFTPWSSLHGYVALLEAIRRLDLVEHVAPIQLGIRLLIPEGSRLLDLPDVGLLVGAFDPAALAYPWVHRDARVDQLQKSVVEMVGRHIGADRAGLFERVWQVACRAADVDPVACGVAAPGDTSYRRTSVPYLDEPWYC
jgi:hypothetical protein